jgi:hypothetical protein
LFLEYAVLSTQFYSHLYIHIFNYLSNPPIHQIQLCHQPTIFILIFLDTSKIVKKMDISLLFIVFLKDFTHSSGKALQSFLFFIMRHYHVNMLHLQMRITEGVAQWTIHNTTNYISFRESDLTSSLSPQIGFCFPYTWWSSCPLKSDI